MYNTNSQHAEFSRLWTYLIIIKIGDHHKNLTGHAFWGTLGEKHVLWPAASTEIELFQWNTPTWSVSLQLSECSLKWYCQWRISWLPFDGVWLGLHCIISVWYHITIIFSKKFMPISHVCTQFEIQYIHITLYGIMLLSWPMGLC